MMMEIRKPSNINVRTNHIDAWANFYSDVWRREFGTRFGVMPGFLLEALARHLKNYNANISQDTATSQFTLVFDQECDYTWFELKWAAYFDPAYT
jgi:hypothetical protein